METIRKLRVAVERDGKSLHQTARDLRVSRNTVRKVTRNEQTAFAYRRRVQPMPVLGVYFRRLEQWLAAGHELFKHRLRSALVRY